MLGLLFSGAKDATNEAGTRGIEFLGDGTDLRPAITPTTRDRFRQFSFAVGHCAIGEPTLDHHCGRRETDGDQQPQHPFGTVQSKT